MSKIITAITRFLRPSPAEPPRDALEARLAAAAACQARARQIGHDIGNLLLPTLLLSSLVADALPEGEARQIFGQMVEGATKARALLKELSETLAEDGPAAGEAKN
jgi:hypothetical protein